MKNFKKYFYEILITRENFYMKQYYSSFHKKQMFLAIKELKDGIYCVLISDDESMDIDYSEAVSYIKTLKKLFSLNMIIMSNDEYIQKDYSSIENKLIINQKKYVVISCDEYCTPLKKIFNNVVQENEMKSANYKGRVLQYKVPTFILMSINIIIFLITAFLSGNIFDIDSNVLSSFGAKSNILIEQGQIWRLLTCAFLHSGIIHIGCNMYSLYIIGPQIHQIYGESKYLVIYIISCIAASLASYFMSPYLSVGASGGIFGLMGALLAFAIVERHRMEKKYISSLMQIIIINLFIGLSIQNIDNSAHIGGLIGGGLIGYIIYLMSKKKYSDY